MDGGALSQQAASREREKLRKSWRRGRSLSQSTGTGVTALLPKGQGERARGKRTHRCVFSHKITKTTEGFISFPITVEATAITIL